MSEITNKELAKYLKDVHQTSKEAFGADFFDNMLIAAERLAAMPDGGDRLYGFDVGDLEDISDSLLEGYEQKINVGNVTGEGDSFVDSTTKAAADFIKAVIAKPQQPAPVWLSAKDGQRFPKLSALYLVKINGHFQEDVYQFDQCDDGNGGREYFWYRGGDECPPFDPENDLFIPLSTFESSHVQQPAPDELSIVNSLLPDGWMLEYNKKPVPDRSHDWAFTHLDYDFCSETGGNGLAGTADSPVSALKQILEIEFNRGQAPDKETIRNWCFSYLDFWFSYKGENAFDDWWQQQSAEGVE